MRGLTLAGLILAATASMAMAKTPTHKTMADQHPTARASCLNNSYLVSHVAFTKAATQPDETGKVHSCSQLLSTDTLITVKRWNQT